jgi:hypothetical protein
LIVGELEIFLEAIDLRIANVGSVEEGDQIEQAEPRDQLEVELPEKFAIL